MSPRPLAGPRLARLLAIVPYVQAHPGTTLGELADRFRVDRREIQRDLELLPFCGLPPYTADRLIDVWIDDDMVDIRLAEYFERPLRLTPAEGVALVTAARALLGVPGADPAGPLASAATKLEQAIGAAGQVQVEVAPGSRVTALRDAATDRETVEIEYHAYARDEMTTRRIDPERVFHAFGAWYCAAWCHRAGDERLFRVDRIRALRATGDHFEVRGRPADDEALVYHPRSDDPRVTLRLAARVAWVADDLPVDSRADRPDGGVEITFGVSGTAFLERLLLRLGPDAEIVDAPFADEVRRAAAARVLGRYRPAG